MTTTESITPEAAHNLLVATSTAHPDGGIGTPTTSRRNYSLAEAMACAAICDRFTLQDTNGFVVLTGHNAATGDHRWYIDFRRPRQADPWA